MKPVPVQWVTREMVARLGGPHSLLQVALHDAEWERAAARWLMGSFGLLVAGFSVAFLVLG